MMFNKRNGSRDQEITISALSASRTFRNREELKAFVDAAKRRNEFTPLEFAARVRLDSMNGSAAAPPPPAPSPPREPETEEEADLIAKLEARNAVLAEAEAEYVELQARMFVARDEARARIERARIESPGEVAAIIAEARAIVSAAEREEGMAHGHARRARAARNAIAAALDDLRIRRNARYYDPKNPHGPGLTHHEMLERLDREGREVVWRPGEQ